MVKAAQQVGSRPLDEIRPHPGNPKLRMTSPVECPACGRSLPSRSALGGHVTRKHYGDRTAVLLQAYTDQRGPEECWPWRGTINSDGYAVLVVDRTQRRVSRLALGLRDGDPIQACHRCDNPGCVNVRHLFAGSAADNQHDKAAKGRAARGEANRGGGKLTAVEVREIRASTEPRRAVAATYGVSGAMVSKIRNRQAWSHL